jgi:phosphoribulokinase
MVVIHFRDSNEVDFSWLLQAIPQSTLSRHDTLVIPGPKMALAMELIIRPMIQRLMAGRTFA